MLKYQIRGGLFKRLFLITLCLKKIAKINFVNAYQAMTKIIY